MAEVLFRLIHLKHFLVLYPYLQDLSLPSFFHMVFMLVKVNRYLTRLNQKEKEIYSIPSGRTNLIFLIASAIITISLFVSTLVANGKELGFVFAAGTFLLITIHIACQAVLSEQRQSKIQILLNIEISCPGFITHFIRHM